MHYITGNSGIRCSKAVDKCHSVILVTICCLLTFDMHVIEYNNNNIIIFMLMPPVRGSMHAS